MKIDFRKAICRASSSLRFLYDLFGCSKYYRFIDVCDESGFLPQTPFCPKVVNRRYFEDDVPQFKCGLHFPPTPPPPIPPEEYPQADDYNGTLLGMSAYSLIRYPLDEIEWFFRELVLAGGNATEFFPIATWDDCWSFQPYKIAKYETEMWKDKDWTPSPDYRYPVFHLYDSENKRANFNEDIIAKWRSIFSLAEKMNLTISIRVQDFCSRKDNFLERHWCFWSCVESWRWGGSMSGGYLHWPIGAGSDGVKMFIWPHYERLNRRLISELKLSGVKFYLEDWNELFFTKGSQYSPEAPEDDAIIENEIHKWFIDNFKYYEVSPDRIFANPQRGKRESESYRLQTERLLALGASVEHHGVASPETMKKVIALFGEGSNVYPNGDGMDKFAKGINDGRPDYTEPSVTQAEEMGRLVDQKKLKGFIFKSRTLRKKKTLKVADFSALRALARGFKS